MITYTVRRKKKACLTTWIAQEAIYQPIHRSVVCLHMFVFFPNLFSLGKQSYHINMKIEYSDIWLTLGTGGLTMKKNVTLSCPEGYELACMKERESDKCCCCCISVTSPIRESSS